MKAYDNTINAIGAFFAFLPNARDMEPQWQICFDFFTSKGLQGIYFEVRYLGPWVLGAVDFGLVFRPFFSMRCAEGSGPSNSLVPPLNRIPPKLGETQPGPEEHRLQYAFSFWFSKRAPGRQQSPQNYEQVWHLKLTFVSRQYRTAGFSQLHVRVSRALNPCG